MNARRQGKPLILGLKQTLTSMLPHRREFATYLKRKIREMYQREGLICSICQQPIESKEELTVDHWRGAYDNRAENAQPAHRLCNLRKGNRFLPDNPASLEFTERLLDELRQDSFWQNLSAGEAPPHADLHKVGSTGAK